MVGHRSRLVGLVAALLLIVGALTLAAQAQPPRGRPPGGEPPVPVRAALPWVDVHMHLIGGRGQDWAGAVDTAVGEMDRFGITLAIILPPPQIDGQPVTHDAANWASVLQRHPGRFAFLGGGGTLNRTIHRHADPGSVTDAVKRDFAAAAEEILDRGAAGFGEMASLHISATSGHPYEFVPADHPLFLVLADVAARRDVPIDLHLDAVDGGMPTPPRFAAEANPPTLPDTMAALGRLLAHNPQAKIVWAHGGSDPLGAMTPAAIGRLMDAHPNLYVSVRIVGPQAPVLNKALAGGGLDPAWADLLTRHADRLVIGTDSFMVASSARGSGPGITFAQRNRAKLEATNHFLSLLPPDVARKVGRDNAARLYKVTVK
jgi:predicted TIM-barrel fold metal-dependent hydrolase